MSEAEIITQEILDSENVSTPAEEENFLTRNIQIRYILALMGFWCFFVTSSMRINISMGIVAMVNWTNVKSDFNASALGNECYYSHNFVRTHKEDGPFPWSPDIQGHILSCFFYGLAATQLLGGRLAELVSAKYVLLVGTLLATLCNCLIPPLAGKSGYNVMALQIFKGFGQGIILPSFSVLMSKWVPVNGRARFMSITISGLPVGGFFATVLSGIFSKTPGMGWPYVFYVFGFLAALWCLFWIVLIYDSPLSHPYITKTELNKIVSLRTRRSLILNVPIPLKEILTSKPVWAYLCAGFASSWALCLYISVIPMFMGTILKFNIETNGLMSAIPHMVEAFFLVIASIVSHRLAKNNVMSTTNIRKICISTGLLGFTVCMVTVTFTGCQRVITVLLLILALGIGGFTFASTACVPVDMAPRFAGSITGLMNTFGVLSGVIIPTLVGYLTRNSQTMKEWSLIFYLSALITLLGAIAFLIFGSGEMQPWNNEGKKRKSSAEGPKLDRIRLTPQEVKKNDGKEPPSSPKDKEVDKDWLEERPWRTDSYPTLPPKPKPEVIIEK